MNGKRGFRRCTRFSRRRRHFEVATFSGEEVVPTAARPYLRRHGEDKKSLSSVCGWGGKSVGRPPVEEKRRMSKRSAGVVDQAKRKKKWSAQRKPLSLCLHLIFFKAFERRQILAVCAALARRLLLPSPPPRRNGLPLSIPGHREESITPASATVSRPRARKTDVQFPFKRRRRFFLSSSSSLRLQALPT